MAAAGDNASGAETDEVIRRGEMIELTNELAHMRVCKIWTRNRDAGAHVFLAPDRARGITSVVVNSDGGIAVRARQRGA